MSEEINHDRRRLIGAAVPQRSLPPRVAVQEPAAARRQTPENKS
jgi:hypothetical protein